MNDENDRGIALGLLSFAAGSMDAIAFLTLGDVFTSAMSGNTILLGLALGQGRMSAASHALAAFVGYVVGVAGAALPLRTPSRGIERTLVLEALFLAAFAGLWTARGGPVSPPEVYVLIILSAIAMGLQGAVGRAIRIPGIPTIVITSTLTAIVGTFAERVLARDRPALAAPTRQQIGTFLIYLASAVVTGFAVSRWLAVLPFVPLAVMLALASGLRLRLLRL
jgi:uncharacterized membrane protein YoaK (UPF0700 family)